MTPLRPLSVFSGLALALTFSSPVLASSIQLANLETIAIPFGSLVDSVSINDQGDIAGTSASSAAVGFIIPAQGGAPVLIDQTAAQAGTFVTGINNQDTVAGDYLGNGLVYGFTYNNGTYTPVAAGPETFPTGINNHGDVTGYVASLSTGSETGFLIKNGVETTFSVPGFTPGTYPAAVNDSGQVVGSFNGESVREGFLRNPDGSLETFGFAAQGINDAGIIVGSGVDPDRKSVV